MGRKGYTNRAMRSLRGDEAAALPACGKKGCKLPWLSHFTKAGTQRKTLKDHFPADFQAAMASASLIARVGRKAER